MFDRICTQSSKFTIKMSQKTHPTSLRIASNYKNFYSCWYSDYFYSELLPYDLEVRSYIQSICNQSRYLQAIIRFQNSYKRFFITVFFIDTRGIRHSAEKALRLPVLSLRNHSTPNFFLDNEKVRNCKQFLNFSKTSSHIKNNLNLNCLLSTQNKISTLFETSHNSVTQIDSTACYVKEDIYSLKAQNVKKNTIESTIAKSQFFHSFLDKNIQLTPFDFTTIYPVRVLQEVQNAEFLAGEIVYLLQKRAHFRQIQSFVLRKIAKNVSIKGIRLSCSGRVGGRSKKAQKSKTQSVQWGETSLHVFSSKLDFASKSASTLFGKVGVKVWLCYR